MSQPRTYQTEAIIIKKTKLGEADSILTLYTPTLGKIQGFAKSVRKTKSRLAGHLELLTHSQVTLARGRNLDTITGSQTINAFMDIKNDLWLTSCALYAAELVNQFTAHDIENGALFNLLLETLKRLPGKADAFRPSQAEAELVLRYFELHLLKEVGYRPQLRECVACHKPVQAEVNYFCPGSGGIVCQACTVSQPACYAVSVNAQKVLRLFQDSDWTAVDRIKVSPALSAELERVMGGYLRWLLEREVKAAGWLNELREQRMTLRPQPKAATPPPTPGPA